MITIVDFGMGNLRSIQSKLAMLGFEARISRDAREILSSRKLIFPGVGHFGAGIEELKKRDLIGPLTEAVMGKKTPILGICLGMQLFGSHSEEGDCEGLGWLDFSLRRFRFDDGDRDHRVPHVGWNDVEVRNDRSVLFRGLPRKPYYFTHSYFADRTEKEFVMGVAHYGGPFAAAVEKENIFGTQFHPEKSHKNGLELIHNFLERAAC